MYFFIDPANLTTQLAEDAYGPSDTDPTNIYRTTSRFDLTTEAKAFACRSGMMLVQQSTDDNSLVNLIIRPDNNLEVPVDVEYYVYRGVRKDSLISENGSCTIQIYNAATSNDLISRMRQDSLIDDFSCSQIGYDNSLLDTDLIDDFFSYKNLQISPVWVKEGEWIGTFGTAHKIGFEIILKSDSNNFTIGFLRAANHQINVTGLAGFAQRLKREDILKFIDPVAFFGMHHTQSVDYYVDGATNNTETTIENTTLMGNDRFIYTKLLENFHTRNNVYVDIRSEKGYSYNFYQNYKINDTDLNNIQIRTQGGNTPLNEQEYRTNQWPILILTATHTNGDENSLKLRLRIDDNTKPILYTKTNLNKDIRNVPNTSSTNVGSRYFKTNQLIGNGTNPDHTTWTNVFRILFPNTQYGVGGTSNRAYISNYVRLHYYRTKHNTNNTNDSVLENIHYYDSAFCSIDIPEFSLPDNLDVGSVESANPIYVREPLHYDSNHPNYDANYSIEGTGNFELNMINGAYWGDGRVLMYARIEYENTTKVSGKEYLNTYDQQLTSFEQNYSYGLVRDRLKFLCREYDITGNTNNTKIPSINFFRSNDLGGIRNNAGKNHKENCMLLGLSIDEMISIKADTQLSNNHKRFIHLEPLAGNPQQDNNDNRYFAYTLQLQGFDTNQHADIVTPQHNSNNIIVYSRDNQFFSSYAFSEDEDIDDSVEEDAQNRVEFHIYNDGVIKINDNIDFALLIDRNTDGDNTTRIYYKYYNVANNTENIQDNQITNICDLGFVIANKMKNGVYYNSTRHGALTTFTLNHINHHQEAIDANINGVNADNSFENNDGDIMTDGYFTRGGVYGLYRRYYENTDKKTFLVHFDDALVNASPLAIDFSYDETLRHYAIPELAAGVLGVLIQLGDDGFISTGFSYRNSSCYPSVSHVNGKAIDIEYSGNYNSSGESQPNEIAHDVLILNSLYRFGFAQIIIGNNDYHNDIYDDLPVNHRANMIQGRNNQHDNHIHSYYFSIRSTPIII